MKRVSKSIGRLLLVLWTAAAGAAQAITITPSTNATTLVSALLGGASTGIVVTSATLNAQSELFDTGTGSSAQLTSSGTYTNATGTYGIGPGVVLTTGAVEGFPPNGVSGYSDGPNNVRDNTWVFGTMNGMAGVPASAGQESLLDPITQNSSCAPAPDFCNHFDVTELIITFDMQPNFDHVSFNIVFGSEEWPEFRDSSFIDGFGMFLNGVNIATTGGFPVNIKHPDTKPEVDEFDEPIGPAILGTELDGILAPNGVAVLTFSGAVNATGNTLRFIVADTSDGAYDTTVYFSALEGVPAPPAAWLLATGAAGLLLRRRARRS